MTSPETEMLTQKYKDVNLDEQKDPKDIQPSQKSVVAFGNFDLARFGLLSFYVYTYSVRDNTPPEYLNTLRDEWLTLGRQISEKL